MKWVKNPLTREKTCVNPINNDLIIMSLDPEAPIWILIKSVLWPFCGKTFNQHQVASSYRPDPHTQHPVSISNLSSVQDCHYHIRLLTRTKLLNYITRISSKPTFILEKKKLSFTNFFFSIQSYLQSTCSWVVGFVFVCRYGHLFGTIVVHHQWEQCWCIDKHFFNI
jgi:hypothetical protein